MGRNSGQLLQQLNSSYFISNENFYKSHVKSLQCFLISFFHKDKNHLDIYTYGFLSLLNHKRSYIVKFALCKQVLLVSMRTSFQEGLKAIKIK